MLKLRKSIFKDLSKKVKQYGEGKNKKLMGAMEEEVETHDETGDKLSRKISLSMASIETSFQSPS